GGAIIQAPSTQISGANAILRGSAIGSQGARINTAVDSVDAATTNGAIYITDADGLAVTAAAANGLVDVRTTAGAMTVSSASGNGVTLIAGGAGNGLTVNGLVSGGAGGVGLQAAGAIVAGASSSLTGNNVSLSGSAVGASGASVNTTANSVN